MSVKESSLKNLKPNKSHWNNSETCTIRIPQILKEDILKYAKKLDNKDLDERSYFSNDTIDKLGIIVSKVKAKEKGYKNNSASQLIRDLLNLM